MYVSNGCARICVVPVFHYFSASSITRELLSTYLQRRSLPLKPLQRLLVILQQRRQLIPHFLMILIQPLPLLSTQQLDVDHVLLYRTLLSRKRGLDLGSRKKGRFAHHSHAFQPEESFVSKVVRGLCFLDEHDVLDANAESTISVVSGL